jgi:LiaI-LiaF-like transmembrane region
MNREFRGMTGRGLIPGLILVVIGLVFLGINYGVLSIDIWRQLAVYWPVLLVLLGLRFIMGRTKWFAPAALIIIGLTVWAAVWGPAGIRTPGRSGGQTSAQRFSAPLEQISRLDLRVETGAVDLRIAGLDTRSELYRGSFDGRHPLSITKTMSDNTAQVAIAEPQISLIGPLGKRRLDLAIAKSIPSTLQVDTGAAGFNLDLSELPLTHLGLSAGASSGRITLGQRPDKLEGEIKVGASSLTLRVPRGAGLRLTSDTALSGQNFEDLGLTRNGNVYQTTGYDSQAKQIDLNLSAGVSSIKLELY